MKLNSVAVSLVLPFLFTMWSSSPGQQPFQDEKPVYYENQAIVLMYHHIDEQEKSDATISPEKFESHMQMLLDQHYNIINMQQFIDFIQEDTPIPENAVLITFDDGYESFYTEAYPILKKYNVVASHFIIGHTSDFLNPEALPHLTWDQMREMDADGMNFYNHTYDSHRYATVDSLGEQGPLLTNPLYIEDQQRTETEDEYKARIYDDLRIMEQRLADELGEQDKLLAFPFGAYNEEVVEVGKQLDIQLFFTTVPGINQSGYTLIYRINAGSPHIDADVLRETLTKYHSQ